MVFLIVALIFLFSLLLVWWLTFPEKFKRLWEVFVGRISKYCRIFPKVGRWACISMLSSVLMPFKNGAALLAFNVKRYRSALSVAGILLFLPPVLVVLFRGPVMLEGYDASRMRGEGDHSQIASLLQGERLVPPRPLPPQVFTTAEVELIRPRISIADRSWEKLDVEFMQRLLVVYKIMQERHGYSMVLLEGYRSPEKQAALSSSVTNAGAGQSYHQYGLAADSAFWRDGRLVISEKDAWAMRGYELYGQVAQELGLTWGGHWKLLDFGHVEFRRAGSGPPKQR